MRTTLIILFSYYIGFGQLIPKDFSGQISYKIDWYSAFIKRDSCGDFSDYRTITENNGFFTAKDSSLTETYRPNYLKQKFIFTDKVFFIVYFDPNKNALDTSALFPMKINDTINGADEYLVQADSNSIWNAITQSWHFNKVAISVNKQSEGTRLKDATVIVLNKKTQCYKFEKYSSNLKSSHPSQLKQTIYIDKLTLLPVEVREYIFYSKRGRCKIPGDKWFLISKTYITAIKNWH
jgi:hypothetical protein